MAHGRRGGRDVVSRRRPTGGNEARLLALEQAVERLREEAESGTVVVEGSRDLAALEWLGVGGLHVPLHQGRTFAQVVEDLAGSPPPVILLVDWDRTGGRLLAKLESNLRARVRLDTECRRRFLRAAHSKCLEDIPAELAALRRL
jgi:5S rRNA maturation endonuclease (ribonuclease M5)